MGRDDPTLADGDPPELDAGAGLLAGRYALDGLVGRGASGQVFAARDLRTDRRVAVKLVADRGHLGRQVRRELIALRLLRLPGVVELLDDGEDRGRTFLVMELLPGGPLRGPGGWDRWGEPVVALLRTLARVHLAGVVHRDLKPSNILLDDRGAPVITDFGLAQGRRIERPHAGPVEGTPRYMAPEQRRGEPCDARADLYAVGVMLAELVADGAPPEVVALVRGLRAEDPADRPGSAWEALEAIGVRRPDLLPAGLPEPATADRIAEQVFGEPEVAFLRTERDAAELLVARTGGRRDLLRAELESWVRSGIATDARGAVRVDPVALRQLRLVQAPWYREIVGAASPADAALRSLDGLLARGALDDAFAALEAVLPTARDDRRTHVSVVRALARVAMDLGLPASLDHAAAAAREADEVPVLHLVSAFRAAATLDRARALELVPREPLPDEELEIHRVGTAALATNDPAAYLDAIEPWATVSARRRAKWLGWAGNAAYREGRYADAASLHERSAASKDLPHERINSWMNAAAARLELGDPALAAELADRAADLADEHRLGAFAARGASLARIARYRAGATWGADRRFVDAVRPFGAYLTAVAALTEASVGWRAGHPDAAGLAEEAAAGFRSAGNVRLQLLADALRIALGAEIDPGPCLAYTAAVSPADACGARTAAQILGLLAPRVDVDGELAVRLAEPHPPDLRLDVLSAREVSRRVRGQ